MTVKNVDYKQEPIKIPFNFQWGLFLQMLVGEHRAIFGKLRLSCWSEIQNFSVCMTIYLKNVYADQSILKLSPKGRTIMCLIQCIDCPSCNGLSLVPLKDDYFNGRKPKCFWFWPRKDLVCRFKNSGNFHTVVYDHFCKNPGCPRKDPNYQPTHSSKLDGTCGSFYCELETCRLVVSSFEDYCKNHHPRPDLLDKQAPQFRIRLARGDGFEVDDFVFMFFNKKRKWK